MSGSAHIGDFPNGFNGVASRYTQFQNLMPFRVQNILLVSSYYDAFQLAEDGEPSELMLSEYLNLNLRHAPGITPVTSGREAIKLAKQSSRFNLIITTMHLSDMHCLEFAKLVKAEGLDIPVILLTYNMREINDLKNTGFQEYIDKVFLWQGDFRILLAIVKYIEDKMNIDNDLKEVGLQVIILVEDNVRFYSSYLPMIYQVLMEQSQRLIQEGVNTAHKLLRMRARPKILLCTNFEQAWDYYQKYEEHILGIISDMEFPMEGKKDTQSGTILVRRVKQRRDDIPILLQSSKVSNEALAKELKVSFVHKYRQNLLEEVRNYMLDNFGFGDFIFRLPGGEEVGRAADLRELERILPQIPDESIRYHGERNHFSNWLKARTEFNLAEKLKPKKVSDYKSIDDLRKYLIDTFNDFQTERRRGIIVDFNAEEFNPEESFARIGGGSLGGKARGLAFIRMLIENYALKDRFPLIKIYVPPTVVIGTEVFDKFLEINHLRHFALESDSDQALIRRFLEAEFPVGVMHDLISYLQRVHYPLAVRSSSLMEDSQYQPFAGVYDTFLLANMNRDLEIRLGNLLAAVKRVYASTFARKAKAYFRATPYRLEEEKMAVILQKLVGSRYGSRFYPTFSGVARSTNYYPTEPLKPEDGMAVVALGLGKTVVEGEPAVNFCPRYPRHLIQFSNAKDSLEYAQKRFYYLELKDEYQQFFSGGDFLPCTGTLNDALADGTLNFVGSIYSPENNAVYDGISRQGVPLVTFAPILKHKIFPLPEILEVLLKVGSRGMSNPVEIEFAVDFNRPPGQPKDFAFLQLRPLVLSPQLEEMKIEDYRREDQVCSSIHVLGNGIINDIKHIIAVDYRKFNRSDSVKAAREVGIFNSRLTDKNLPYLLIGMGRWGTADPWLGIPVKWEDISGAKVIIETGLKDMKVTPSQGTHFFQNITSLLIGYFTINLDSGDGYVDWDWLLNIPAAAELDYVRLIELEEPLTIKMNGYRNWGVILKPGVK